MIALFFLVRCVCLQHVAGGGSRNRQPHCAVQLYAVDLEEQQHEGQTARRVGV